MLAGGKRHEHISTALQLVTTPTCCFRVECKWSRWPLLVAESLAHRSWQAPLLFLGFCYFWLPLFLNLTESLRGKQIRTCDETFSESGCSSSVAVTSQASTPPRRSPCYIFLLRLRGRGEYHYLFINISFRTNISYTICTFKGLVGAFTSFFSPTSFF